MTKFTDDLTEQPGTHDDFDYPAQDEQDNESLTSEGHDQAAAEQQPGDPGSDPHAVDNFDEGETSNDAEPEQVQPAEYEESTVDPLSGDEGTEQPVGAVEDNREQGSAAVTDSENGYPRPTEGLDTTDAHEHPDDRNTPPLGENSTEYEEVVATNEVYELDNDENDQGSEHGVTVAVEGDTRDADWATTAPDAQHLEWRKDQDDAETDKREQVARVFPTVDLTPYLQIPGP